MTRNHRQMDATKDLRLARFLQYWPQWFAFFAVLLLAAVLLWSGAAQGRNVINSERNAVFEQEWRQSVDGGGVSTVKLPVSERLPADSRITLENQLPAEMVQGATLLIRSSQQDVEVFVNGTSIYNSREAQHIASPSSAYHFVRLPTNSAGQTIQVVLSSPYENYAGFMNQIYIGSKASNLFFLLHENGLRFIIGFLIFSSGCLLTLIFLFSREREGKSSITSLGAFFLCAGYWVMVESRMMQFIFPYPVALTNTSIFALSLLPVFSALYYYAAHAGLYQKSRTYVVALLSTASLLLVLATCADPRLPLRILPFYLAFSMLYLFLLFGSIVREHMKTGKFFSISVCGMLAFGGCALLELMIYLYNTRAYNQSNFLTLGLLLFSIFLVTDSVQSFTRVYHSAVQVKTLSVLAYTDSLTGLQNRTAFLEAISAIDVEQAGAVTIAMYDVNGLKPVNDTMGHLVGDALLRHSAKAIKASLRQEDGVYRIGGDEFVAILRHGTELDSGILEKRLLEILQKENQKTLSYTLSIAYGFATFSSEEDRTLFDTQARADKSMYACKKIQKRTLKTKQSNL